MRLLEKINKIPAGTMIVPLLVSAILNTVCPSILRIGSYSQALISDDGLKLPICIGILLCTIDDKIRIAA